MRSSIYVFILFSIVSGPLFALAQTEAKIPVISQSHFQVGRSWTWDYFDPNGKIYSTERYTVLKTKGSQIVIEMASDYSGGQALSPHHRLIVDLKSCLAAYKNPVQKKPWKFRMSYFSQGQWKETEPQNTLAFEEKFNCNGHLYSKQSEPYLTVFSEFENQPVFMQKLWRRIEGTWFGLNGNQSAVAVGKSFPGSPGEVYKMKLRPQTQP